MSLPGNLKVEMWPIEAVIPYDTNVKKHPPEQVAKIAESITKFNWDQPIVVDRFGVVIKGHGRRLAAISLGLKQVPVLVRTDLTPEQVKASRLADNRAAVSDLDPEMLRAELASLEDIGLLTNIFDDKELGYLAADLGEMAVGVFVEDMGAVVEEQQSDVEKRMENAKAARVPTAKAFGFKDLSAADQIVVSNVMARASAATGLSGADAFVRWAKNQLELGL